MKMPLFYQAVKYFLEENHDSFEPCGRMSYGFLGKSCSRFDHWRPGQTVFRTGNLVLGRVNARLADGGMNAL